MSWVQHKKPPINSTTSSPSPLLSSNYHTSSPSLYNTTTNRNVNSLRPQQQQASPSLALQTQQNSNNLTMTSQYTNKFNNSLLKSNSLASTTTTTLSPSTASTTSAMRLNPNTPYQAQQQLHQQQQQSAVPLTSSAPLQQQRQHQQQSLHHNPTSQQQTTNAVAPPRNNMLGGFNSNQQQNSWSTQQQPQTGYLPSTKMMQPTPPPPAAVAPVPAANCWPQQQPTQQQQNYQNVNMYQQPQQNTTATQPPPTTQQQWPQNPQQTATFDNYYQQQPAANNNNMFQQPQQPQSIAAPSPATFFQQQPTQATQNPVNFFDTTNNNNQANNAADGWDDWGWNDNNTITTETTQLKEDANTQNLNPGTVNPNTAYNSSIITDSFNSQNNNDAWNWGTGTAANDNEQQLNATKETQNLDNQTVTQNDNWNWPANANDNEKLQQQQQQQIPVAVNNEQHNDNWNHQTTTTTNENQQLLQKTATSTPPPPPPTEFSTTPSANLENHNYNTNVAASSSSPGNSNIPNTVFVSQAKPVTLPSRQFASPPGGNTPVTEHPPETALMPPQAFQNIEESSSRPQAIQSPALQPPNVATPPPPLSSIPPPAGPPPASNAAAGNPFKRSGVAQHHRASNLMASTSVAAPPLTAPNVFSMPPPPPADFANPASVSLLEPDNNELPSQENQEVLSPPTNNITLPNAATTAPPTSSSITLPNSNVATPPQPLNDERNQYLQTSHLSENSEEQQQPETDGLLPPPGLSRLVLGEPELEASQQRMVMGTEAPQQDNAVTQAAVMHLEERHADGEDTASENAVNVTSLAGQAAPPSTSAPTSDRNLYLVPGESNNPSNNQQPQRVVTGVELAEQREIDMDGENLEDEQIQQQQQQHHHQQQQQHHQHQPQHHQHPPQNQHHHTALSPEARNEPPVEGADDNVAAPPAIVTPVNPIHQVDQHQDHHPQHHHHHSTNQLAKSKDTNTISSPNDDDDSDDRLLNERVQSTAGSSKSRSKYENERLTVPSSRRRDKRSSVERYESDEYLNSEGEYSSEREERERRERDRRRNYREGSVRSERGGINDEDEKRSRRHRGSNKRDKYYYNDEERSRGGGGGGGRDDRERDRTGERSKTERRRTRGYDNDSRYETEESTRFDSRKDPARRSMRRSDRSDQGNDYDDYNRRSGYRSSKRAPDNYESDRKDRRRSDKHREPRYRDDPRYDPREYEDYRKHSSRNARESDMEKDAAGASSRSGRMHHDPRHAAMYGYPSGGYYDPYTYYYQQMARTNPQAYADWYKKYYGQAAVAGVVGQGVALPGAGTTTDTSLAATANDGRESVHSGRSSAHNDMKDRYTHAYITQANEYHQRHYQQQQQHLHHQQHLHQQQHHQQQMAFNQTLNSTMLDDEVLNHNTSLYSGLARSNTNLSQIHGGYYMPAGTTTASTTGAAGVYYARSDYAESRSGALSVRDPDPVSLEPQRLTPCKFINEHTVVSFASGILVTVKPKYTPNGSISNIVKLLKFKPNDETRKLFKVFPGPLVRGLTHKKTVIEFCHEQIRLGPMETTIYAKQLISNNAEKYRASYTLMWNLLILLLKQNGMVVGTDIAELLLKNQQQYPYQTPSSTANNSLKSKSGSASPIEELDLNKETTEENQEPLNPADNAENEALANEKDSNAIAPVTASADQDDTEDNSLTKSSSNSNTLSEVEITEKFRNYLLYGNVNEALEWATDNNLWGHALFLASKLDRRSHANVMMKFANKLSLNDPLQTLYQLMSGRTPSSVTCVQDEKWGDWRPHLSMILSNTSQKPELDRKAITTLGDSLFNRGDLYAAHFCYLMAQVGFGRYQETATQETSLQQHLPKLVLLGSSHYKQFQEFAHNEAIVMTEIYEYACSLNDDKFSIVEFQPYKFLLATRLLDYGFHLKSLMYLEQIAVHIARDPTKYESSFINKVYELADRLKYYDPVLEKTIDDQQPGSDDANSLNLTPQQMEEQKWLQNLRQLAQQYKQDFNTTNNLSAAASVQDNQYQQSSQDPNYYNQQQQIDQQFMDINKQFSELNLQYQQPKTGNLDNNQQQQQTQQQPMFYNPEQQQQMSEQPVLDPYLQQQQQQPPQQSLPNELPLQNAKDLQQTGGVEEQQQQDLYQQQYLQPSEGQQQQTSSFTSGYYDPSQYNAVDSAGMSNLDAANPSYDYWGQQQQTQPSLAHMGEENARPTISMPKSKTYDTDDEGSNNKQQPATGNEAQKKQQQAQQQQKAGKKEDKDANKNQQQSNQNSGWFGGIWNKFSLKPKNQMILPDDKNPSIVWDPEKKKWVNTDGDEDEQESLKPPPKMSDLMPQQQQQQQQQQPPPTQQQQQAQTNQIPFMDPQQMSQQPTQFVPNSMPQAAPSPNPLQQQQNQPQQPAPAKTPTLQSNMFKMQRNRTLKNAYVDVFNPSGAPVNKAAENILAPALPPAAVPQGGFFIPGGSTSQAADSASQQQDQYQQQTQQQNTPQFYNPNQFTGGTGY